MASTSGKCLYYGSIEMDVRARKTVSTSYYSSFSLNLIKFLVQLVQRRGGKKERKSDRSYMMKRSLMKLKLQ